MIFDKKYDMINKILNRIDKKECGLSIVEFAIILPLFLLLFFGIIEFGVLMYDKAVLTDASREGARLGIVHRFPKPTELEIKDLIENQVKTYAEDNLVSFKTGSALQLDPAPYWIDKNGNEVSWSNIQPNQEISLVVTTKYQFSFLVFSNLINLLGGSDSILLRAQTVMRLE